LAESRVLEDTIVDTVKGLVALIEDVALHGDPLVLGQETRVVRASTGELDEAARPVLEMLKVGGGRTGNDTIEVIGEVLGRVQTLLTTSGATDVVGLGWLFAVELVDDVLTSLDRLVARTVSPVEDFLVVLEHPRTIEGARVVSTVVTDRGKAEAADILHINVVHATIQSTVVSAHGAAVPCGGVTVGKPDLHVCGGGGAGGNIEGDTAQVKLGSERGTTADRRLRTSDSDVVVCGVSLARDWRHCQVGREGKAVADV